MTLDLEKIKAAALDSAEDWYSFTKLATPSVVLELITRLEEADTGWHLANVSQLEFKLEAGNEIKQLQTKLEAAEKDATRYQLLKNLATAQANSCSPIYRIDLVRTKEYLGFNVSVDRLEESEK